MFKRYAKNSKFTNARVMGGLFLEGGLPPSNEPEQPNEENETNETTDDIVLEKSETDPYIENEQNAAPNILRDTDTRKNPMDRMFETIDSGTILYHPSTDIKQFNQSMIFVPLEKVTDMRTQRSFTMFFTPNLEYAKRFSGLWSLNKRPVYVHVLKVRDDIRITGIKIIDPEIIPDHTENTEFAKSLCGDTLDGFINGIKIEHPIENNQTVAEYYFCNPSLYFSIVDTWMQFGSTEWMIIPKNKKRTIVGTDSEMIDASLLIADR